MPFTAAVVAQQGRSYEITWTADAVGGVAVFAGSDPEALGTERAVGTGGGSGTITVDDLPHAPRWYFALVPDAGDALVVADRSLHLATAPNLRDIGGYRTGDGRWVRMGRLYRSGCLDALAPADAATLDAIGFQVIADLRTDAERASRPDLPRSGAQIVVMNVLGGAADSTQLMTDVVLSGDPAYQVEQLGEGRGTAFMIASNASLVTLPSALDAYRELFAALADPASLPAVFHCTAGKDRTGWAAAALLSLLGVPRSVVVDDYLASNGYLAGSHAKTLADVGSLVEPDLLLPLLGVDAAFLQASFDAVDVTYGSIESWVTDGLGLAPATITTLRDRYLVPG